jgi:hypothetical protein
MLALAGDMRKKRVRLASDLIRLPGVEIGRTD